MSEEPDDKAFEELKKEYDRYLDERKLLIDAARESARTFDQAVLAFGSAIFAASIAFLKDVAPHPQLCSLKWLGVAWLLFSFGLLGVMLSFLFSHKACMFEIEHGAKALGKPDYEPPKNRSSTITTFCNYFCVALLFLGLVSWSGFALENVAKGENTLSNPKVPPQPEKVEKGYTPPPPAPRITPLAPPSSPPPPAKK
jgi:hypothetical protein